MAIKGYQESSCFNINQGAARENHKSRLQCLAPTRNAMSTSKTTKSVVCTWISDKNGSRVPPIILLIIIVISAVADLIQSSAKSIICRNCLSLDPGRHLTSLDMAVLLSLHSSWISCDTASFSKSSLECWLMNDQSFSNRQRKGFGLAGCSTTLH
jgi:hypothetical protein